MQINSALQLLNYVEIVNELSTTPFNIKKLDQLKHFYAHAQVKLGFPRSIINAAVIYALRIKKGVIPSTSYLEKTLQGNFKNCKTTDDAVSVLSDRINFEIESSEIKEKSSQLYKAKTNIKNSETLQNQPKQQ